MRGVVVVLLLATGLAGCADGESVETVVVQAAPTADEETEAEYLFTLYGDANVTAPRRVDVRLQHDGRMIGIVNFDADPGAEQGMEALRAYLVPAGLLQGDVVADGEIVGRFHLQPDDCPTGESDAILRVGDAKYNYLGDNIEVDYGCTS